MKPIGYLRTCYAEKFGVPRQPGIVEQAWGELVFEPEYRNPDALRGLEGFSHVWLIWEFHQAKREGEWKPTVRPPRLGGNERVGVFATRSPFRPNNIGLSVCKLEGIEESESGHVVRVSGVDIVDGTPVFDLKPYIPYADAIVDAKDGFAPAAPEKMPVTWLVETDLSTTQKEVIAESLALDPRPAYQQSDGREYGCRISGVDVRWMVSEGVIIITEVAKVQPK